MSCTRPFAAPERTGGDTPKPGAELPSEQSAANMRRSSARPASTEAGSSRADGMGELHTQRVPCGGGHVSKGDQDRHRPPPPPLRGAPERAATRVSSAAAAASGDGRFCRLQTPPARREGSPGGVPHHNGPSGGRTLRSGLPNEERVRWERGEAPAPACRDEGRPWAEREGAEGGLLVTQERQGGLVVSNRRCSSAHLGAEAKFRPRATQAA